jgi:cytochrome c oxidase subunit III
MADNQIALHEQFETLEQQKEASTLGMWTFLSTEVLFFGGLFMSYIVYRSFYAQSFKLAGRHTILLYGTVNTAILLTSSLTAALSVHAAQQNKTKWVFRYLLLTIFLGACFLGVKGLEYYTDITEHLFPGRNFRPDLPAQGQIFWFLYWAMTGLHGLHVLLGLGILSVIAWMASRRKFSDRYYNPVEVSALYWHFVDIVWIFLYPLFYLIDRYQ